MTLLHSTTLTVRDCVASAENYRRWMGYRIVEQGTIAPDLAAAWGAPASAGRSYCLCQPESGAPVYLRFVEGDPVPDYLPIRTFGWAAVEICVQDVEVVARRMAASPFEIIGPPNRIAGLETIYPMQVRGPDLETVYLTQMLTDAPDSGLPHAACMIDRLFILVLACADMAASAAWFADTLAVEVSPPAAIRYSMIAKAFGLPSEQLHRICTATWAGEICLEFDQYPAAATVRPRHADALVPGVAICTLLHPQFDRIAGPWFAAPVVREGAHYGGRRAGVLQSPEGALVEVIDGG